MPEAWELVPDEERKAEMTVNFIVFCEDEVSEFYYLKSFQKPGRVQVNVIGDQKSGYRNINNTLLHCEQNGLLEKQEGGYRIRPGVTEHIWSMFDLDLDATDPATIPAQKMTFSQSIHMAKQAGINVAWSNDAFELWILLHFEDVEPGVNLPRQDIYQRLTAYFKVLVGQSPEMAAETAKLTFNYKGNFKRRNGFNLYVLPSLEPNREHAEQRAEALEAAFNAQHAYHERNPCTQVHHLVRSILSFH